MALDDEDRRWIADIVNGAVKSSEARLVDLITNVKKAWRTISRTLAFGSTIKPRAWGGTRAYCRPAIVALPGSTTGPLRSTPRSR
jgi:hypothetical protein